MADWRDRGFVPDSDDEDEDAAIETQDAWTGKKGLDANDAHNDDHLLDTSRVTGVEEDNSSYEAQSLGQGDTGGSSSNSPTVKPHPFDTSTATPTPAPSIVVGNPDQNQKPSEISADTGSPQPSEAPAKNGDQDDVSALQQDGDEATAARELWAEDLQAARDHNKSVVETEKEHEGISISSRSSSPLTEPPSSPPTEPFLQDVSSSPMRLGESRVRQLFEQGRESSGNMFEEQPVGQFRRAIAVEIVRASPPARAMRQRNPIQLHPYMLESERYRQSLKARGVKPLRIAHGQAAALSGDTDSQEKEFEDCIDRRSLPQDADPLSDHSSSPSTSQVDNQHQVDDTLLNEPTSPDPLADTEEFPDVDSLLRGPLLDVVRYGHKRRKTSHLYGRKDRSASRSASNAITTSVGQVMERDTIMLGTEDVFDIPPSPPLSGTLSPHVSSALPFSRFRFPGRQTPIRLETPVTSSAPAKPPAIEISEDSDSDVADNTRSPTVSSRSSRSPSLVSEQVQSHQIERAQRKIRGVLPASWLRLDLRTQATKPETNTRRDHETLSPSRTQTHRGVARKLTVPRHQSSDVKNQGVGAIYISDDSDESPLGQATSLDEPGHMTLSQRNAKDLHLEPPRHEVEEDDRIDAMLPSQRRRKASSLLKTKRQTRLPEGNRGRITKQGSTQGNLFRHPHLGSAYQPRITEHLHNPNTSRTRAVVNRKPSIPKLSVLDAPQGTHSATPQFIRLAARQARSRKDRGRHSPSRKYIRLGNRADTEDAQSVLRQWRQGTMAPVPRSTVERAKELYNREPLQTTSGNEQRSASFSASLRAPKRIPVASGDTNVSDTDDFALNPIKRVRVQKRLTRGSPVPHTVISKRITTRRPNCRTLTTIGKGRLLSSLQKSSGPRLAQLESRESENNLGPSRSRFKNTLSQIDRLSDHRILGGSSLPSLPLARFLETEALSTTPPSQWSPKTNDQGDTGPVPTRLIKRPRKRRPQYIDADAVDFRQPTVQLRVHERTLSCDSLPKECERATLLGLAPFGTQYTVDFDIAPLAVGTFFHESTFVGSGEFAKSLRFTVSRELDVSARVSVHQVEDRFLRWGAWNENVSSELGWAIDWAGQSLSNVPGQDMPGANSGRTRIAELIRLLRFIIRYFNQSISFLDPIDRSSFVKRCTSLVNVLTEQLKASSTLLNRDDTEETPRILETFIHVAACTLVIANQIRQIALHEAVDTSIITEVGHLVKNIACYIVAKVYDSGSGTLRSFLEDNRQRARREAGIREDNTNVETLVITNHVLQEANLSDASIWDFLHQLVATKHAVTLNDVRILELIWYNSFTLLPLLEFDETGLLEVGRRFRNSVEGWNVVKRVVSIVLEISLANPEKQSATFNNYLRALFHRCLHLIKGWGWQRCEAIIGTLFDFFAHNNLAHLRHEESYGSPRFLQELDKDPNLDMDPDDRCYHILLKIIGTGLKAMRHVYPDKKIRNIAWRLMPNHGRLHPKDKPVRQEDLDALRNHHDLLCTIYWASPPGFRPRLDAVRNLVDPGSSHREACHISIRAWSNLIRYQLSTDEPAASLLPFAIWHEDFIEQMLSQHSLARGEAESQFTSAAKSGNQYISTELLESTISTNQRQVEAVVSDALQALKTALSNCRSAAFAKALFCHASTGAMFDRFDVKQRRLNSLVLQALDIVLEYTRICKDDDTSKHIQQANDDSQEYGDWSVFEDVAEADPKDEAIEHLHNTAYGGLARLISNCFGADATPDDALLLKVTNTWVSVAKLLVSRDLKQWSNYVGVYGSESWASLRSTEQTRKYTAYFMSRLIEEEPSCYEENKTVFLHAWVSCLVERESLLKFQHRLTSALLNVDPQNELLANLPVCIDSQEKRYSMSATEFRVRRLSLISSFLSNMRQNLIEARNYNSVHYPVLLHESRDLLRHLMDRMKSNYQELGHGTPIRGAYVDFVHRVVEFLQQHVSDIHKIDAFFTDSSAFPLPATDPTYVVGRLKSYGLRIADPRTPKQLVAFVQTVTERAVVDNQQVYLVDQLQMSMADAFEAGDATNPTLRAVLVEAVFPAYISLAFDNLTGWLLAKPILEALQRMYKDILDEVDGTDYKSVDSVLSMTTDLLSTMRLALEPLVDHLDQLDQSSILSIVVDFILTITATLSILDYLHRLTNKATEAIQCISSIASLVALVAAHLSTRDHDDAEDVEDISSPLPYAEILSPPSLLSDKPSRYVETRHFASNELRRALNANWVCYDGKYYVLRGNVRKEVFVQIGSVNDEKKRVFAAVERFFDMLGGMKGLGGLGERHGGYGRREGNIGVRRGRETLGCGEIFI